MSPLISPRPEVAALTGYHSAQVDVAVRLNTNESPFPPPAEWTASLAASLAEGGYHRYPDRTARRLREDLARLHSVEPEEIYCANGSNEVLLNLLRAFGGPGRRALVFPPTYQLHTHIARTTLTEVVTADRREDFRIDPAIARSALRELAPDITFLCSPNNPTGLAEDRSTIEACLESAPGLVVVDEAYGQFSRFSALELRGEPPRGGDGDRLGLVVVKTFSKTWAMAGVRLGYLIANPTIVEACEAVTLPYHLSTITQEAGRLALQFADDMAKRVAVIAEERGRVTAGLAELDVEVWPSDANFILFRPRKKDGRAVWEDLVAHGVLIRDCSSWEGLSGCLRVTVGTTSENDRFLDALKECV